MAKTSLVYAVSLVVHGGLAAVVAGVREPKRREVVAISVAEAKKKPPEPAKVIEPPKPVETKPDSAPKARPRPSTPAPQPENPPPEAAPRARSAALDALPNLGLSMGNGPGGIAVPQGGPIAAAPPLAASAPPAAPKVLAARQDDCTEALVKPKPKSSAQPALTSAAREASVEGKVRVEVSVAADGSVTGVRLLGGLGYGLDEASLEAARRSTFQPATRCGKPVAATLVMGFRFQPQ
jgi:protein TonB